MFYDEKDILRRLISDDDRERLLENGRRRNRLLSLGQDDHDAIPLVMLFTPDANWLWLLSAIDPLDEDRAYGLCDDGLGVPMLDYVSLPVISCLRGRLGLPVLRHPYFVADKTLRRYAEEGQTAGLDLGK